MCKCECDGKEILVLGHSLRSGNTKSCGCQYAKDLTNMRFGKLNVIKRAENYITPQGIKHAQWLCKCDCGKEVIIRGNSLLKGDTKSCGCLRNEKSYERLKKI